MGERISVEYSEHFQKCLKNFPKTDQLKIRDFVEHIKNHGFDGLQGRNKSSDNVPKDDPQWSIKVAYAQKYNLWHYHIGIPTYELSQKGDKVSEYILHYIKGDDFIKLVSMSYHPPFELPSLNELV